MLLRKRHCDDDDQKLLSRISSIAFVTMATRKMWLREEHASLYNPCGFGGSPYPMDMSHSQHKCEDGHQAGNGGVKLGDVMVGIVPIEIACDK